MKMFFAPDGNPIESFDTFCFASAYIEIVNDFAQQGHFNEFPTHNDFVAPLLGSVLSDIEGSEWLEQHCRLVEVPDAFDTWAGESPVASWPDEIVEACRRVSRLGCALWALEKFEQWLPKDVRDDPISGAALNHVVKGRLHGEVDSLQATIKAWREANPDLTQQVEVSQ